MLMSHMLRLLLQDRAAKIPIDFIGEVMGKAPPAIPDIAASLVQDERDVGQRVADFALKTWAREIREPKGHGWEEIDEFIRGPLGLGWSTADAKGWKPNVPYTKNRMFAWCGAFAAWCWGNYGLRADIRHKSCSSTYRLNRLCVGTARNVLIDEARPGDIAIVSEGIRSYGEHVTLVVEGPNAEGLITTVEGNATGLGPKGVNFEGVIKRTRPLQAMPARARCPLSGRKQSAVVINVFRFLPEDLAA